MVSARVGAGDGDGGVGGFEGVERVGSGCIESDDFSAEGQVFAVVLISALCLEIELGQIPLTSLVPKRTYRRLL